MTQTGTIPKAQLIDEILASCPTWLQFSQPLQWKEIWVLSFVWLLVSNYHYTVTQRKSQCESYFVIGEQVILQWSHLVTVTRLFEDSLTDWRRFWSYCGSCIVMCHQTISKWSRMATFKHRSSKISISLGKSYQKIFVFVTWELQFDWLCC